MSKRRSNSNDAMLKFVKERVKTNQGISLQNLTGHMSQLPSDLRNKYGCSVKFLKVFLEQFPKVFVIRQRNVYVRTKSRQETSSLDGSMENDTPTTDRGTDQEEVTSLTDVRGTVYRMFSLYGFISIKNPIKARVYFNVQAFENAKHTSLPSSGLQVGDCVILDAEVGPKDCKVRFRATRVTRAFLTTVSASSCFSPRSVNDVGGADCDTITHLVNQLGVIETIKAKYGFIKFGPNLGEMAFFHVNDVAKSLGTSIKDLQEVFAVEDKVRFSAKPSEKPSDKVKWEATTVYLCPSSDRSGDAGSEDEIGSELFMSDEESNTHDLLLSKLHAYESREADFKEAPEACVDSYGSSFQADSSNFSANESRNERLLLKGERKQKLSGERGFFYPVTESVGTIKFGPDRGLAACAAVEVTYHDKELVANLLWEVPDGQEVSFDAVQADGNTWIATMVWIGQRPAKTPVGDTRVVLNRVTNRSRSAQIPLPNAEPSPRDNSGEEKNLQNVFPDSQNIHPPVAIYKDVKGIIVKLMECAGTCEVRELAVSRKIEFTSKFFYKDGTVLMGDLKEVLCEGDTVFLDYMVGVSGTKEGMRCDLVWQGRRPKGVWQMSPEEFWQTLQIDTQPEKNSLSFEDFETNGGRADKASRGPSSPMPLDTGFPEDSVPSRESEVSSSTSVANLLAAPPAISSTPIHMRFPRARSESSIRENAAHLSLFLSAGVNDGVLLRFAKMVAAEIIAEEERLRVVLRDVGVQTSYREPFPSPSSRPDALVPPLVSSSAQTLSTGEIGSERLFIS